MKHPSGCSKAAHAQVTYMYNQPSLVPRYHPKGGRVTFCACTEEKNDIMARFWKINFHAGGGWETKIQWIVALHKLHTSATLRLLYSGKLSREKTCTNFMVLEPPAKFSPQNLGVQYPPMIAFSTLRKFSPWNGHSNQSTKVFSLKNFPPYSI